MFVRGLTPNKNQQSRGNKLSNARNLKKKRFYNILKDQDQIKQKQKKKSMQKTYDNNFKAILLKFTNQVKNNLKISKGIKPNYSNNICLQVLLKNSLSNGSTQIQSIDHEGNNVGKKIKSWQIKSFNEQKKQMDVQNLNNTFNNLYSVVRKGRSLSTKPYRQLTYFQNLPSNILRIKTDISENHFNGKLNKEPKKFIRIGNETKNQIKDTKIELILRLQRFKEGDYQSQGQFDIYTKQCANLSNLTKKYKYQPHSTVSFIKTNKRFNTDSHSTSFLSESKIFNENINNCKRYKAQKLFGPWTEL